LTAVVRMLLGLSLVPSGKSMAYEVLAPVYAREQRNVRATPHVFRVDRDLEAQRKFQKELWNIYWSFLVLALDQRGARPILALDGLFVSRFGRLGVDREARPDLMAFLPIRGWQISCCRNLVNPASEKIRPDAPLA
jgi:hypothetical protein